jgi:hypothetical protein
VDVRDLGELKVVEARNRSASCVYARVVFISFRYSGSAVGTFTGLRGTDGKWGRRRCATAAITASRSEWRSDRNTE